MNKVQKNVLTVLDRIKQQVIDSEDDADGYAEALDAMLNNLNVYHFFGTEAQSDPRGDYRNGDWSIHKIEE